MKTSSTEGPNKRTGETGQKERSVFSDLRDGITSIEDIQEQIMNDLKNGRITEATANKEIAEVCRFLIDECTRVSAQVKEARENGLDVVDLLGSERTPRSKSIF